MKYEERLIKELKNPDGNLWHEESWMLSDLDGMAKDMLHFHSTRKKIIWGKKVNIVFLKHKQ